ncbi:hypothetical protein Pcinc_010304 [Petrolisthes cinctipes]|uniref:Regulatory protein zeste n=1 Tax=Petrolisthes cinctipes TaxID=88211 RepID=A0AAE1G328_PETCI|nr:hypothetical protein Pcinc_010304 [Petrolisthes cinctipes]
MRPNTLYNCRRQIQYLRSDFSSPGCTHRGKLDAWDSIANQLHEAYPDSDRTVKECQKRWQTIQSAAKTRIARYNQALTGTGGGPATPDLDELDQLIADILGKQNITFGGVRGKNDLMTSLHEAVEQQPRYEQTPSGAQSQVWNQAKVTRAMIPSTNEDLKDRPR